MFAFSSPLRPYHIKTSITNHEITTIIVIPIASIRRSGVQNLLGKNVIGGPPAGTSPFLITCKLLLWGRGCEYASRICQVAPLFVFQLHTQCHPRPKLGITTLHLAVVWQTQATAQGQGT